MNGNVINLDHRLNGEEKRFYKQARRAFRRNIHWVVFDNYLFDRLTIRGHPSLCAAIKDMWIRLGIKQGLIKPGKKRGKPKSKKKQGPKI
jgi:hypothetical protein